MFEVKAMRPSDFYFATQLANTMNWNMTTDDFKFAVMLEPNGCFVIHDGSKPIGIATSIIHGKIGWFGNLIVKEEYRNQGAGKQLVKHAIKYLLENGATPIGLYALPHLTNFYQQLGFQPKEDYAVMYSPPLTLVNNEDLPAVSIQTFDSVAAMDSACFGGDRKKLLQWLMAMEGFVSCCLSENRQLVGFAMAKVYANMAELGPLGCQKNRPDLAIRLLRCILGKVNTESYVFLPKKETVLQEFLLDLGFKERFHVTSMFFGKVRAKNCIYLAESLERG